MRRTSARLDIHLRAKFAARAKLCFRLGRTLGHFDTGFHHQRLRQLPILTNRYRVTTANMRTYDDTFSGQKIYPGKVRSIATPARAVAHQLDIPQ